MSSGRPHAPSQLPRILTICTFSAALCLPAFAGREHSHRTDHQDEWSGARHFNKASKRHRREDYQAAAEGWQKAYELGYREATSAYNTACALSLLGDTDLAIDWLETAIADGFDIDEYLETDDDLIKLRSEPRFLKLRDRHRSSLEQRGKRGAYAAARDGLTELESSGSDNGRQWYRVGMSLHQIGEYDDAIRAWQHAVDLDHEPGASTYNIACAQARSGQIDAALDSLALAVERGYGDADYLDEDDDLDSIRDHRRFPEIREAAELLELPSGGWGHGHGNGWFFGAGWKTARTRYENHVASNPKSGRGWFNLGYAALELDDEQAAVEAFGTAHELGFRTSTSAYNLACSYARLDDRDAAFSWLERAIDSGFTSYDHFRHDDDLDNLRKDARFDAYRTLAKQYRRDHGDWREHLKQGLRHAFGGDDDDYDFDSDSDN